MSKPAQHRPPTRDATPASRWWAVPIGVLVLALGSVAFAAGDLLRGGAPANTPAPVGAGATGAAEAAAAQLRVNAADRLARTTQALQAVQAMQAAARAAALAGPNNLRADPNHPGLTLPNVPDGLVSGGLKEAPGIVWQGAAAPVQTAEGGRTTVAITQTAAQAILSWETFNVGKNTTVAFDQSAGGADIGQWVAFNKINDPAGVPSQILGSITAGGQVYLLNRNGVIFGGSSQVNAHALVVSSLPINTNLVTLGLLNNADQQFLFSSLPVAAGSGTPAFTPATGATGDVTVQPGARLSAPTSDAHVGGRIALLGANVTNAGTIAAPDGQTILAAGLQVGLAAHASSDPSLRGLDVFVGAVTDPSVPAQTAGAVANTGLIDAPRASVVLTGKDVTQLGAIENSTSVAFNGRVDLLASYDAVSSGGVEGVTPFFPRASGTVTLGPGSVTRILPELASTERVTGTALALPSQLNLRGLAVHLAGDAAILAPGATVAISAGRWSLAGSGLSATNQFVFTGGQIYLDAGALIDVAGAQDVAASVAENFIEVQLRGSELADSPLQRDGALRGQTIKVDVRQTGVFNGKAWVGTSLANTAGYVALISRTVGELTIGGGTVTMRAGESVIVQPGATVDVSGGWINYAGATVETSKVLSDGHVFDIAAATPDRVYSGLYTATSARTDAKWGVTTTAAHPLTANAAAYEPGYLQGGNAGTLAINAPALALDGDLRGQRVVGPRQLTVPPASAALQLTFQGQYQQNATTFPVFSPTPPEIVVRGDGELPVADAFALDGTGTPLALRVERRVAFDLDPALVNAAGFGRLTIDNRDGNITVPAGVALTGAAGGSLTLLTANLDLGGRISVPGGSLVFTAYDFSPFAALLPTDPVPAVNLSRGRLTVGATAVLDVAGLVVDNRPGAASAASLPLLTTGGSITLTSHVANLEAGSVLDVSGGVAVGATGKISYGNGGGISISAGQDPSIAAILGGSLALGAELRGFSGAKGGSLTLLAPLVQVGGPAPSGGTLWLAPEFFSAGGFTSFTVKGLGATTGAADQFVPAVVIAPGTTLAPVAQSWLATTDGGGVTLGPTLQPAGVRPPVSLAFNAVGVRDPLNVLLVRGDLVLGAGAVIRTEPKGSVTLAGETVTALGSVIAPGGAINVSGGRDSAALYLLNQGQALPTVVLGANSVFSAAGTTVLTPDARGYRTGSVLAGGSISITGNLVAEPGARLDVSGAADTLDLLPAYGDGGAGGALDAAVSLSAFVPTRVESNGGTLTLAGGQELFTDATLRGAAGGTSAAGGRLVISSGRFYPPGSSTPTPLDVTLEATQTGPTRPAGGALVGVAVDDGSGGVLPALGHFAADSFNGAGFDALTLKGVVEFSGPVSLTAPTSLRVADGGVLYADAAVSLIAPHVALGTAFQGPLSVEQQQQQVSAFTQQGQPYYFSPTFGAGTLTVAAQLIELGNLSLQNIGRADLLADNGDIRGDGTLDIAGDLLLRAGQIYPPTGVSLTLAAYDYTTASVTHAGSITVAGAGTRTLPLSAGGTLNLRGSSITQGGVLRAPLGTISLGGGGAGTADLISNQPFAATQQLRVAPGSVTSVAGIDPQTGSALTIPYGTNLNGTTWLSPAGDDITVGGVPGKSVNLSAVNVNITTGAEIDLRGGGDLYAYRFVAGTGGTTDILSFTGSFAVIPGYTADYAPFDPGYANATLAPGDRIYFNASDGLPAGFYTLLPARYALLPGAFLVTPQTGAPAATVLRADGSNLVAGWRGNGFNSARTGTPLFASFEVASSAVVRARAQYEDSSANAFLRAGALANDATVPRLPVDSGQLVLAATAAMSVQGAVAAAAPAGGRGGLVDISSPADILIAAPGATGPAGTLVLDAAKLSAFGAESLLIGGVRSAATGGTAIAVKTGNLTLANAGSPLTGPEIILVANQTLTLAPGAVLAQTGALASAADPLLLGAVSAAGSGNGVLLRVSADATAQSSRAGVTTVVGPALVVGAGASVTGAGVTLDSTRATSLDPAAVVSGTAVSLNSGQISLQLTNPGALQPTTGLVLSGGALQNLQASAQRLSLLSYSSLDLYGTGEVGTAAVASLALHAGEVRGFNTGGGTVTFAARDILLDNAASATVPGVVAAAAGTLVFNADTVRLGAGTLALDQFTAVALTAAGGILAQGTGAFTTPGALTLTTPILTGATAASQSLTAGGALTVVAPAGGAATVAGGLGARLALTGASVTADADITLPSGALALRATTGNVTVSGRLDTGGTAQTFFDLTKFTDAGSVSLTADAGSVDVTAGGSVHVAAAAAGGNAGSVTVGATVGAFTLSGALLGTGGAGGTFALDVGALPTLAGLDAALDAGGFAASRAYRVRTGGVTADGTATARKFSLSADGGSITVSGTIDASGTTGGAISLAAQGSVTLLASARLTAAAQDFDSAGKGGVVSLEAGASRNGVTSTTAFVDVQTGSTVDLSVAANTTASAALGRFTGTLHLRAPQTAAATDLQLTPLNGTIVGASSIVVEGYKLTDLTAATATLTSTIQNNVKANGTTFGNATAAITARLLANNAALASVLHIRPGAEIINRTGNLVLAASWDLSTFRFGPASEPGILTLRAAGNLSFLFKASLSDGFTGATFASPLLAAGAQSWSYRLVAGADLSAADFHRVQPLANLATGTGSVLLGTNATSLPTATNNSRSSIIPNFFQVIRTGTGDIDLAAGRDVQLLNPLAAIYTAGTQAVALANYDLPILDYQNSQLGNAQTPAYPARYTLGGGNVSVTAQNDITHLVLKFGVLVADSTRELPTSWLYRRGYVSSATGQFAASNAGGEIASTSWWVDFSNYFEGVGALGGGSVTLTAGRDVSNVDALVPTNARMPKGTPNAAALVELGGGDLTVRAGRDIDGGVYYVERGRGTLTAGGNIHSNTTRAALTQSDLTGLPAPDAITWLPTTLFLGKSTFDVTARGDLLLGPAANPFLLPQGINNSFYEKTYFSTYAPDSAVSATSLVGAVTLKTAADGGAGSLQSWFQNVLLFASNPRAFSASQPWLRLAETNVTPFATVTKLLPPTLRATAFTGDLNLVGGLTLVPSPSGTVELAAAGSVNGFQPNSLTNLLAPVSATNLRLWGSATINLSDADPARVPSVATPLTLASASTGRSSLAGIAGSWALTPAQGLLDSINRQFAESGSFEGAQAVIQTKQALHAPGPLHAADPEPVRLYAEAGNLSGLTLFAGKAAQVIAGRDLTDLSLYLQNNAADEITRVIAGRDLIAYHPNSPLRLAAQTAGNALLSTVGSPGPGTGNPTAGDLQLGGPGTFEVLAGRNFDLGVGPNNADGTATGLTTIGNSRNPYLPFDGASIVAGAGLGGPASLDFAAFNARFLDPGTGGALAARYLPELGRALGLASGTDGAAIWATFSALPASRRAALALDIFYLVLRDAGREHNDADSPGFKFQSGFDAIAALFPGERTGDISLTSRAIKTVSGGDLSLYAPGGALTVGFDIAGQSADQGILTAHGGGISIFTAKGVNVGTSRIFTLRGGNEIIWASTGNIAAGASSKTVQSAPPTRVLIDPQSGDVKTDLAGLATGGGIGVLATVVGVEPGDVDLIAPTGTIDAGDAGIRSSGRLNVAAVQVLNASNISSGGTSSGVPAPVAAPSLANVVSPTTNNQPAGNANDAAAREQARAQARVDNLPSIITVEVLGYGGGEGDSPDKKDDPAS